MNSIVALLSTLFFFQSFASFASDKGTRPGHHTHWYSTRKPLKIALGAPCIEALEGKEQGLEFLRKLANQPALSSHKRAKISATEEKIQAYLPEIAGVVLEFFVRSPNDLSSILPIEDALQEAFLILVESAGKQYEAPFGAAVHRKIRDHFAAIIREAEVSQLPQSVAPSFFNNDLSEKVYLKLALNTLREMIQSGYVTPFEADIFIKRAFDDQTFAQIGEQYGYSLERMRQIFSRTQLQIKRNMGAFADDSLWAKKNPEPAKPNIVPPENTELSAKKEPQPFPPKFSTFPPRRYLERLYVEARIKNSEGKTLVVKDPTLGQKGKWKFPGKVWSSASMPEIEVLEAVNSQTGLDISLMTWEERQLPASIDGSVRNSYFLQSANFELSPAAGYEAKWVSSEEIETMMSNQEGWANWWTDSQLNGQ